MDYFSPVSEGQTFIGYIGMALESAELKPVTSVTRPLPQSPLPHSGLATALRLSSEKD